MRSLLFVTLLLAACSRSPDDAGAARSALEAPPHARLVGLRTVARGEALAARLSPDGRFVAVTGPRYRGLRVVPAEGGEAVALTDEAAAGLRPAWSHDGRRIAYVTLEDDRSSRLRLVSREGGEPQTVHHAAAEAPYPLAQFTAEGELLFLDGDLLRAWGQEAPVATGLEGTRVARLDRGRAFFAGERGILSARADGTEPRTLFPGASFFDFALSPDGTTLLARELREEAPGFWSLDLASGTATLIDGFDRGCALPSGRIVAERLESSDGQRLTRGELWLMRSDGEGATRLETPPGIVAARVDCAEGLDRIAFADDATDSILVADVEVLP